MAVTETRQKVVLMDAGVFIGALLRGDQRHAEARPLVEQARQGILQTCTTTGILSEVYGALTWEKAEPRHAPAEAAEGVRLLVEPPFSDGNDLLEQGLDEAMSRLRGGDIDANWWQNLLNGILAPIPDLYGASPASLSGHPRPNLCRRGGPSMDHLQERFEALEQRTHIVARQLR